MQQLLSFQNAQVLESSDAVRTVDVILGWEDSLTSSPRIKRVGLEGNSSPLLHVTCC